MRRRPLLLALVLALSGLTATPTPTAAAAGSYTTIDHGDIRIGNSLIERRWHALPLGNWEWTQTDKRTGRIWGSTWELGLKDGLGYVTTQPSNVVAVTEAGGHRLDLFFDVHPGLRIQRSARVVDGVAAVRMQTTLHSKTPLALDAYTLEQLGGGTSGAARAIGFRGGADWNDAYDYRDDSVGTTIDANAEWLETVDGSLALLMQRRNYHSSRMRWRAAGAVAEAGVDFSYDLVYLGPFEETRLDAGIGYPRTPLRARQVEAGVPLALEPVIVAMGTSPEDVQWQAHRMLREDMQRYPHTINFNTDRVRGGPEIGVRDGVNLAVFQDLLPIAKDLGAETFVLDDGWQLYNGDWRVADRSRYPNGDLTPVRTALEANGMRLGLWMAAGSFHPSSEAFKEHPLWACAPVGLGTAAYNALDPDSGSNAAGIGVWSMRGVDATGAFADRLRDDIDFLVDTYDVRQFKFDFLVWLDCLNAQASDMYLYRDTFFAILDSLRAEHPGVGFGVDETNDFRGFPYESILYGPTWFQNGNPPVDAVLHNAWTLAPYVPGYTIGQAVTLRPGDSMATVDEKMAAGLTYAMTYWTDIRELRDAAAVKQRANLWATFAKQHRALNDFSYPLLADPLGRGTWTGMQPWNPDENAGYANLFRMGAPNDTQEVAFKALDDNTTYRLTDITPTGSAQLIGDFTGAALEAGIPITIGSTSGVRVLEIRPAS